jgi:hypothetical protein
MSFTRKVNGAHMFNSRNFQKLNVVSEILNNNRILNHLCFHREKLQDLTVNKFHRERTAPPGVAQVPRTWIGGWGCDWVDVEIEVST